MKKKLQKILRKSERGQAIILIAFAIIGMIGMVGLMVDGGVLLIEYGRLKRSIDAASVGAALQFRRGYTNANLSTAAEEFLQLNQSDVFDVLIETCDPVTPQNWCPPLNQPQRKLVKVSASRHVTFGFLRVLGINSTDITASSIGEAASIDLVLVFDTSASMSYETSGGAGVDPGDDPSVCNLNFTCEPLESVKNVALNFINTMFFPYDRVAIIASTSQIANGTRNPSTVLALNNNEATVRSAIENMRVFQPPVCDTAFGPCLNYPEGSFVGFECPIYRKGPDLIAGTADDGLLNPSSCTSSNLGGALVLAGAAYAAPPVRQDSFWVTIMLAGGPANATDAASGYPYGYCPTNTWHDVNADKTLQNPFCYDASATTRHYSPSTNYDADDYARDQADFLADPETGQGVTIFTIGLGNLVQHAGSGDPAMGEKLLTYIATEAGGTSANHGEYYYAPDASGLSAIFGKIADNIFTRISQ